MTLINWCQYRFYFSWLCGICFWVTKVIYVFLLSLVLFPLWLFFFSWRRAPIISYYPLFQILKWIRSIADIGNWSFRLSLDCWKGMCLCRTARAGAVSPLSLSLISSLESFSGVFAALFQSVSVTRNSNKPRWSHCLLRHANNYVKTYPT